MLTCAIANPLDEDIRKGIMAANVMMGHDEHCQAWLAAHRPGDDADALERTVVYLRPADKCPRLIRRPS